METPSNPISDFCEGAGKECAKEGIDFVKNILGQLFNKKYAFIGERKTIDHVKKQKYSPEFKFYSNYISDKDIKSQIKMGLALRVLEEENDYERIKHLRGVIVKKYDIEGLHVAELSQNKILMKNILHYLEEGKTEEQIKEELISFLNNIEQNTFFIQNGQSVEEITQDISLKIQVHSPKIFIIASKGSTNTISAQVFDHLITSKKSTYDYKQYGDNKENILFLFKNYSFL